MELKIKKVFGISFAICLILSGCAKKPGVQLDPSVAKTMEYIGYTQCEIEALANYRELEKTEIVITKDQIEDEISSILDKYPSEEIIDKSIISRGDLVKIHYQIISDEEVLFEVLKETVNVGKINFDYYIESSVEGKEIGETYCFDYYNESLSSDKMICYVTPLYIYTISTSTLDDEFVQVNLGYNSVEELYNKTQEEMKKVIIEEVWQKVLDFLIERSAFSINQDVVTDLATEFAIQERISAGFHVDFDAYINQTYQMEKEGFYDYCYENATREIQSYLIVGAIAASEGFKMSEEDFQQYCLTYGVGADGISEENFCYINYYFLRDCIIDMFCDVSIE